MKKIVGISVLPWTRACVHHSLILFQFDISDKNPMKVDFDLFWEKWNFWNPVQWQSLISSPWAFDGKPVHGRGVSLLCNKRDLAYKAFWPWRHNCATENRLLEVHVLLHVLLYSLVLILLNLSFMPFLCPSNNYFYHNRQKILPTHRVACKLHVDGSTARQFRNLVAGWL